MPVVIDKLKAGELVINKTRVGFLVKDRQVVFRRQPAGIGALLTPQMTSATTPAPFVVTSNTAYSSGNAFPWQAFDGKLGTIFHSGGGQTSGLWLALDLGQARNFRWLKMWSRPDNGYQQDTPASVTVSASADGVSWTQKNVFGGIAQPPVVSYMFLDGALNFSARYIRFDFENNRAGNRGYQVVSEIELYGL